MKLLFLLSCLLFFNSSFCQSGPDTAIYDRIVEQLCAYLRMSTEKDSIKRKDYCNEFVLNKNYEELKTYGIDTIKNKDFKRYYDLYLKRFRKCYKGDEGKQSPGETGNDDSFIGSLVKQKKLANGEYSITLKSSAGKTERHFTATQPINVAELKRFISGEDNIIVSYQTIDRDGKKEYKIKSVVYIGTERSKF